MAPVDIVIDTNVLVAALRSRRGASHQLLLGLGEDLRWRMNLSTALVLEYAEVLGRQGMELGYDPEQLDAFLDYLCGASRPVSIYFAFRPFLSDPDDDLLLEVAVASGARYIVTYNRRHFEGVERLGIQAVTPAEFLRILEEGT